MSILHELLLEAGRWLTVLDYHEQLESSEAAIDAVIRFIAVEDRILELPDIASQLIEELTIPLEPFDPNNPARNQDNHSMMAGMVLARSGFPEAAQALLTAARIGDEWCDRHARFNLSWLARTHESATALRAEVEAGGALESPALPLVALVDDLIHQRREEDAALIEAFLVGPAEDSDRAYVLDTYVRHAPSRGIALARSLGRSEQGAVSVTALGLDAVYGSEEAYRRLRDRCRPQDPFWHTALRWVGRVARPESIPLLLEGLQHPDAVARTDVVTSLACYGTLESLRAVARALLDPACEPSDQAHAFIAHWLGERAMIEFSRTWQWGPDGRMTEASRGMLMNLMLESLSGLDPGKRYLHPGEPIDAEAVLECLYVGKLPSYFWYHWVSMTGEVRSYEIHKDVLYNFPELDELSVWLLQR